MCLSSSSSVSRTLFIVINRHGKLSSQGLCHFTHNPSLDSLNSLLHNSDVLHPPWRPQIPVTFVEFHRAYGPNNGTEYRTYTHTHTHFQNEGESVNQLTNVTPPNTTSTTQTPAVICGLCRPNGLELTQLP